jgi:hypothetical protein
MTPSRSAGASLLVLSALMWIAPNAHATTLLDQQYLAHNGDFAGFTNGSGFRRAETFTVGIAGTLTEVDVYPDLPTPFTGFNILSTSGGAPTTTVVATGSLSSHSGGVATFSVSLPVSIGEVLAIEPIDGSGTWLANIPGTYPGGSDYFVNPADGVNTFTPSGIADDFQTFVTFATPEPSSLSLLGAALLGLASAWRRVYNRTSRGQKSRPQTEFPASRELIKASHISARPGPIPEAAIT